MTVPTSGLVFYAPLSSNTTVADTGQILSISGSPQFTIEDGVPCMKILDKDSYVSMLDQSTLPMESSPRTVSIWSKTYDSGTFHLMGYGKGISHGGVLLMTSDSSIALDSVNSSISKSFQRDNKWHNYVFTYYGTFVTMYLDGEKIHEGSLSLNTQSGYPLGAVFGNTPERNYQQESSGYVAACRIYNRCLTQDEVNLLYGEFFDQFGNIGITLNGLFLSSETPKKDQRGLVIDNTFFIPFIDSGDIEAGVVVESGEITKVQPLSFNGTTPVNNGVPEVYVAKMYNTGLSEPEYSGGVSFGNNSFYKCVSVDTESKTWTGYRIYLENGIYVFEDTITSGLVYVNSAPTVGLIYDAYGLAKIESIYTNTVPTDGMVFYASLKNIVNEAETGQTLTYSSNHKLTSTIDQGISCVDFPGDGYITVQLGSTVGPEWSLSMWFKCKDYTGSRGIFNATDSQYGEVLLYANSNNTAFDIYPPDNAYDPFPLKLWSHIAIVSSGAVAKVYVNGEYLADKEWDKMKQFNSFKIGHRNDRDQIDFVGYMTSVRIYNRALDVLDVSSLSTELHPVG